MTWRCSQERQNQITATNKSMMGAHTDVPALLVMQPVQAPLVKKTATLDVKDLLMLFVHHHDSFTVF